MVKSWRKLHRAPFIEKITNKLISEQNNSFLQPYAASVWPHKWGESVSVWVKDYSVKGLRLKHKDSRDPNTEFKLWFASLHLLFLFCRSLSCFSLLSWCSKCLPLTDLQVCLCVCTCITLERRYTHTHTLKLSQTLQSADSVVPGSMVKVLWMAPQRASRSIPLMMYISLETPLQRNECFRAEKRSETNMTENRHDQAGWGLRNDSFLTLSKTSGLLHCMIWSHAVHVYSSKDETQSHYSTVEQILLLLFIITCKCQRWSYGLPIILVALTSRLLFIYKNGFRN